MPNGPEMLDREDYRKLQSRIGRYRRYAESISVDYNYERNVYTAETCRKVARCYERLATALERTRGSIDVPTPALGRERGLSTKGRERFNEKRRT